jgi:hypothetical protein
MRDSSLPPCDTPLSCGVTAPPSLFKLVACTPVPVCSVELSSCGALSRSWSRERGAACWPTMMNDRCAMSIQQHSSTAATASQGTMLLWFLWFLWFLWLLWLLWFLWFLWLVLLRGCSYLLEPIEFVAACFV